MTDLYYTKNVNNEIYDINMNTNKMDLIIMWILLNGNHTLHFKLLLNLNGLSIISLYQEMSDSV